MHFQMRVFSQPVRFDERSPRRNPQTFLRAAIVPPKPVGLDDASELFPGSILPERPSQVNALVGVETEIPLAIRGEPTSVTALAKRGVSWRR